MACVKLVFFTFLCQLVFSSSLPHLCPKDQALALLQFKHMFTINPNASDYCLDITDQETQSYPRTLLWNKSTDCCSWDGVHCDETTGQVIELDLRCSQLQGKFHSNSSLFQLSNLKRLDLSFNDFSGSPISPKFGEFSSLTHLYLLYSSFTGLIPAEISHLSKLHVLHIWSFDLSLGPHNFELLLKNLTQLRELNLHSVNISSTIPLNFSSYLTALWLRNTHLRGVLPERVFHLSHLESLDLSDNPQLTVRFPTTKWNSSASLMELYLNGVNFTGRIPESFSHLTSLHELEMGNCNLDSVNFLSNFSSYLTALWLPSTQLRGVLPERVFHLSHLESLYLSDNPQLTVRFPTTKWNSSASLRKLYLNGVNFTGRIPESFSHLTSLHELDMSYSNLSGPILKPLRNLTNIELLNLGHNHLEGPISHFSRFGKLRKLLLGNNSFDGQLEFSSFNRSWTQLEWLEIWSNHLSGPIPSNVSGLQNLQVLDLSSNYFNGTIPSWIFSLSSLRQLYLRNNTFRGNIQEFKSKILSHVFLNQNQLQGPISNSLLNQPSLEFLLLSQNNFSGQIASAICNLKTLHVLNLRNNNLEGTIPQCLGEMNENLWILDLSNNSLSGTINTTFRIGNYFTVISLHGNKLTGKVPQSLINCKYLRLLDLGNNELNDTFPNWLGDLPDLQILSLRSNKLYGPIKSLGNRNLFAHLQIIDLSSNGFSGNLPESFFGNLQAMKIMDENTRTPQYFYDMYYQYMMTTTIKGHDYDSVRILASNMIIDFSRNRFEGPIPNIIGDLVGLRILNLSHNVLEGLIPTSLQHLAVLESLDLSSNKIGGEIPPQLTSLTFLEILNLSHNHLVGCIPKGKQFDTFENSSYQGNDGLRGLPLSKHCGSDDRVAELDQEEEEEDSSIISWQAVLMGYGCGLVIGLSVIYIMLSTQYPVWFSRMDVQLEDIITTRMKKHKKRY